MEVKSKIHDQADNSAAGPAPAPKAKTSKLKIAAVILAVIFIIIAGAALFVYSRLSELKELAGPIAQTYEDSVFDSGQGKLPAIAPMNVSAAAVEGASLTAAIDSKEFMQAAANVEERAAELPNDEQLVRDGEKAIKAFAKYSDRPIVKDFIAAAGKDPEFAKMLANRDPKDPVALFAGMQKMKNLQGLVLKFALRKDFMPFMQEVTADPDIKPLIGSLAKSAPRQ